jgi:hypothetical protein
MTPTDEILCFVSGSTVGETTIADSISKIAESINLAHAKTKYCKTGMLNLMIDKKVMKKSLHFHGRW